MSDGTALLAAILADPDEDLPRLVYADWLDEQGQDARAKSIRAMVERRGVLFLDNARHRVADRGPGTEMDHWTIVSAGRWPRGIGAAIRRDLPPPTPGKRCILDVAGGFVRAVTCCPSSWWLANAARLVSSHPIRLVELTHPEEWDARVAQFDSINPNGTFKCSLWPRVTFITYPSRSA